MTDKARNNRGFIQHQRPLGAGFTLIETLFAVLLLSTAIAGPLTIAARSLLAASAARDQIAAYYLAQDAVEYVRFARDSNGLKLSTDWMNGSAVGGVDLRPCLSNAGGTGNGCYVDTTGQSPIGQGRTPTACSASCPVINYDSNNNRFTYSTGSGIAASPYTRKILISLLPADERTVTVTVSWTTPGGVNKQVVIEEHIFNWQT